jgi:hypothetical protein
VTCGVQAPENHVQQSWDDIGVLPGNCQVHGISGF